MSVDGSVDAWYAHMQMDVGSILGAFIYCTACLHPTGNVAADKLRGPHERVLHVVVFCITCIP